MAVFITTTPMALSKELIDLCLKSFTSESEARAASPYPDRRIEWYERKTGIEHTLSSGKIVEIRTMDSLVEKHAIELKPVSSTLWGWVPAHPSDIAILEEYVGHHETEEP